jgi:hypothetical protein
VAIEVVAPGTELSAWDRSTFSRADTWDYLLSKFGGHSLDLGSQGLPYELSAVFGKGEHAVTAFWANEDAILQVAVEDPSSAPIVAENLARHLLPEFKTQVLN